MELDVDVLMEMESGNKFLFLQIIEEGKDVEFWGGHFGSRFKHCDLYLGMYNQKADWTRKLPSISIPKTQGS